MSDDEMGGVMLEVGQKVVCICKKWDAPPPIRCPVKGEIYTVRSFRKYRGEVGIVVNEIVNPIMPDAYTEKYFNVRGFRPLQSQVDEAHVKATINRHFSHHLKVKEPTR